MNHIDVLDKGWIELLEATGSDEAIVQAARESSRTVGRTEGTCRILARLMTESFGWPSSAFEFVNVDFRIHCPWFVILQLDRHRHLSFMEGTHRKRGSVMEYYVPDRIPQEVQAEWTQVSIEQQEFVERMERSAPPELASRVAGSQFYTTARIRGNLRAVLHMLAVRRWNPTQHETRCYAETMVMLLEKRYPLTMDIWNRWWHMMAQFIPRLRKAVQ